MSDSCPSRCSQSRTLTRGCLPSANRSCHSRYQAPSAMLRQAPDSQVLFCIQAIATHTEKVVWGAPAAISHRTMPMEKTSAFVVMVCERPHKAQSPRQRSRCAEHAMRVTARHSGTHELPVTRQCTREGVAVAECSGDRLTCSSAPLKPLPTTMLHRVKAPPTTHHPCLQACLQCACREPKLEHGFQGQGRTPAISTSGAAHTKVPGMLCDSDCT